MPSIGSSKLDKFIATISIGLGIPLFTLYIVAMIIYPYIEGDWEYLQSVWDRWQSLNVGILALASSVIAFNISIFNARRQKEKEFNAARAFLPDALSSLCGYLESCKNLLIEAYNLNTGEGLYERLPHSVLSNEVPPLPLDYKEIFSRCISLAEPHLGNHLVKILIKLQIQKARITSFPNEISENSSTEVSTLDVLFHLIDAGELYALINLTFDVARGEKNILEKEITIDDYKTAYLNLKITFIDLLIQQTQNTLNNKQR